MSEQQIMETNLAKLLSQHQSLPELCDSEPADPFQKVHFGRKMKKSKAHSIKAIAQSVDYNSSDCNLFQESQTVVSIKNLPHFVHQYRSEVERRGELEGQKDYYEKQIQGLFKRLRNKIDEVEQKVKRQCKQLRRQSQGQGQNVLDELVGNLEGSIDFIIKDCLKPDFNLKKQSQSNNERHPKDNKKSLSRLQECNKENVRTNHCKKGKLTANQRGKASEKGSYESAGKPNEKSIYQSVLEERQQRRNRKKMI